MPPIVNQHQPISDEILQNHERLLFFLQTLSGKITAAEIMFVDMWITAFEVTGFTKTGVVRFKFYAGDRLTESDIQINNHSWVQVVYE